MKDFKLLCGPILRRAEPKRVCIWFVTDRPVDASAEIYRFSAGSHAAADLEKIGSSQQKPSSVRMVRLGERLYIHLAQVYPLDAEYPTGQLLAYDLILDGRRLGDLGLLEGEKRITYADLPLPTFFLADRITSLFHGSCRNLGGSGLDALPCGDEVVARFPEDLDMRPSILILDGDQIYADHLPAPFIRHLTELGNHLMGWEESIPGIPVALSFIPVNGRQEFAANEARFTSEGAQNQLMSFGEYAALYLAAWNVDNWPDRFPSFEQIREENSDEPPESLIGKLEQTQKQLLGKNGKKAEETYNHMVANLERQRKVVPSARRLLANVPVYMMFDDHDTTDDLFITREWKQSVHDSPTGRRIVANALAAAWAFQCWGNDPDLYPDQFIESIEGHLHKKAKQDDAAERFEKALWDFHGWSFHLPVHPTVIMMDTRTQRGYDDDRGAARLLGSDGLQMLSTVIQRSGYRRGDPIIIVSPTPVVGYETVEGMQERVSRYIGPYRFDLESWRANLDGYTSFFAFLITEVKPGNVIFLAGDVHYGFTISASFTWQGQSLPIVQLTSSAQKNTGLALQYIGLSSFFAGRTDQHFGWSALAEELEQAEEQQDNPQEAAELHKEQRKETAYGRSVYVVKGKPTIMPANYPAEQELEEKGTLKRKGAPDWQDSRTFEPAWGHHNHPITGDNNLGLVRFAPGGIIVHRLLIPTQEGTRSTTSLVNAVPGDVILKPVH